MDALLGVAVLVSGDTKYGRRIVFRYPYCMFEDILKTQQAQLATKYSEQIFESFQSGFAGKVGSGPATPRSFLQSLDNKTIARMLEPLSIKTNSPFEIHLDGLCFVGYPVKIRTNDESTTFKNNSNESCEGLEGGNMEIKKDTQYSFYINIVFILDYFKPKSTVTREFFTDLSKNFVLCMQHEDSKKKYICRQTHVLSQLFDNFEGQIMALCTYNSHLLDDQALAFLSSDLRYLITKFNLKLLAECELATNIKSIYEQFNDKLVDQIQICINGQVTMAQSKSTLGLTPVAVSVEPYETLIFYGQGNYRETVAGVVDSLSPESNPLLVEFIKRCSPFKSLFSLVTTDDTLVSIGFTIDQAQQFSNHLIYHGKARAVLPLSDDSEFVVTDLAHRFMFDLTLRRTISEDFYRFFATTEMDLHLGGVTSQIHDFSPFCSDSKIINQLLLRLSTSATTKPSQRASSEYSRESSSVKQCNVDGCSCSNNSTIIELYVMFLMGKISSANGPFKLSSLINIHELLDRNLGVLNIIIWLLKTDLIAPLLSYPIISKFFPPKPQQFFSLVHVFNSELGQISNDTLSHSYFKENTASTISKSTMNATKTIDTSSESTTRTLSGTFSFQQLELDSIKNYMDGQHCEEKIMFKVNTSRSSLRLLYQKHREIFVVKMPRPTL